jgi:hypothetical protein
VRRGLALLTIAAGLGLAPSAAAVTGHEQVTVHPRVGDVNTRFVYRGMGWEPNAKLTLSHGVLCGTGPCILPLYYKRFHADAHGRFRQTEHPAKAVLDDFAGYSICFEYGEVPDYEPCLVKRRITVVPPWASVTPAIVERYPNGPGEDTLTFAAQHFKAGERLTVRIRYPNGHRRVLHTRARRHGAYVGPAAYAPRGGAIKLFTLPTSAPDGTYRVHVTDEHRDHAFTSFRAATGEG